MTAPTTSDSTGVFLARSTDGGDGWTEIGGEWSYFKPVPIGGLGADINKIILDIISSDGQLPPMWMDNSSGTYQIWTPGLSMPLASKRVKSAVPTGFARPKLPESVQSAEIIRYRIAEHSFVKPSIYNILGDLVKSLVSETQAPGKSYLWDGTNQSGAAVASGFYFISFYPQVMFNKPGACYHPLIKRKFSNEIWKLDFPAVITIIGGQLWCSAF